MVNRNKNKGKTAERELCKILSENFGENWERCFTSGAFTGGKNATRIGKLSNAQLLSQRGDIVPPDVYSNVVIESKFYADFLFHQLVTDTKIFLLDEWINQVYDTIDDKIFWFIAMKINRKGWFFITDKKFINETWVLPSNVCYYQNKYIVTDMISIFQNNKNEFIELFKG